MHTNVLTVTEAVDYMIAETPYWMDDMVAWTDCDLYLCQPGYGTQKGDRFVLTAFHDEFLSAGLIPITLIHWEMTGDAALGECLWKWAPMPGD